MTVDGAQVTGPHVFAGVHPESSHAHVDQLVHEAGHLAPDVVLLQGQVQQTHQTAVAHLGPRLPWLLLSSGPGLTTAACPYLVSVSVVLDVAAARPALVVVEVPVGEGDAGEVLPAGAEPAATRRVGSLSAAGAAHVIDDGVHVDVDLRVTRAVECIE